MTVKGTAAERDGERIAVVLFNLGGPDGPEAVRPFLFNLFDDPAILGMPAWVRRPLAWLIARKRAPVARAIYERIGGRSPIVPETLAQAAALEEILGERLRVFVAMRYWHPLSERAVAEVMAWRPQRLVLLPLYPQFSTATTASSLAAWRDAAAAAGLAVPTHTICCYPTLAGMIEAQAALLTAALGRVRGPQPVRVLFSAHGLPERTVERGDPYPRQVAMTAAAILEAMPVPVADSMICYQSRVGPLAWIGPATDAEIRRAGAEGVSLVVLPIAFVGEHSETLVELDMDYAELASRSGVPHYVRVPTLGVHRRFIAGLAELIDDALAAEAGVRPEHGRRACPEDCGACAMTGGEG